MQVFEEENALDRFEAFASLNGPRFHGISPNEGTITLEKRPSFIPAAIAVDGEDVVPFRGGETLPWSIASVQD